MLKDIRYAFRTLLQHPGFAVTSILSIALAIGANSTIFSYADGLLLRPMSVPNPSEIVSFRTVAPSMSSSVLPGSGQSRVSYPDFEDFRLVNKSFERLVAVDQLIVAFARDENSPVESRLGYQVSGDFFRALHIEPQLGRGFRSDEDDTPGRDAVIVLSHEFWNNEFGGSPSLIGRQVRLNGLAFTVIGVAPESFTGVDPFTQQDFYIPIAMGGKLYPPAANARTDRGARWFLTFGRLKKGVSIRVAAQEAAAFAKTMEDAFPATNRGFTATVSTEREMRLISLPLLNGLVGALFTLAVVILLIACANVANLVLGRGRARAREIAVRLAIGAGRTRLVRLLLIESLMIAIASGMLAIPAAQWSLGILSSVDIPSDLPFHIRFQIDQRVLWFTAMVCGASALVFGLLPAIQSTRVSVASAMKAGESDRGVKRLLGSAALVVVQIAGAMILLVLTVQGRRNFDDLVTENPGFRRDHLMTMRFNPVVTGYSPEQTRQFLERLVERAVTVPGIRSAALTSGLPLTYDPARIQVIPDGYEFPPGSESARVLSYVVDHHYFQTMAVPIIAGRGFQADDRVDSVGVALVNEAFAKEYFGTNPVGKRMRVRKNDSNGRIQDRVVEIIGVTATGKTFLLTEPPAQVVYLPFSQNIHERMTLVAETFGEPSAVAGPLQDIVRSIDPNMPVFRVRTMEDIFEHSSVSLIRAVGRIYDMAAAMGLLMALVGLYAVMSNQVARRTCEIGIRVALGARRLQVTGIFLKQSLAMSSIGVGIGIGVSVFANRLSQSALGTGELKLWLVSSVAAALLFTVVGASIIPAHRAARIDPQQALRQD
jgi:predicted permease